MTKEEGTTTNVGQTTGTKKAVVIFDTKFGNTERIARALTRGLEHQEGVKADCFNIGEVQIAKLVEYDFLALGAPTHWTTASVTMKDFLEQLKTVNLHGKYGYAFDTRYNRRFAGSAAKYIERKLKKLRLKILKQHSSATVKGGEGPLDEASEEAFEKLGADIGRMIATQPH